MYDEKIAGVPVVTGDLTCTQPEPSLFGLKLTCDSNTPQLKGQLPSGTATASLTSTITITDQKHQKTTVQLQLTVLPVSDVVMVGSTGTGEVRRATSPAPAPSGRAAAGGAAVASLDYSMSGLRKSRPSEKIPPLQLGMFLDCRRELRQPFR